MDTNEQMKIIEESAKKITQFQIDRLKTQVDIWKTDREIQRLQSKLDDLETRESSLDWSIDQEEQYLRGIMHEDMGE